MKVCISKKPSLEVKIANKLRVNAKPNNFVVTSSFILLLFLNLLSINAQDLTDLTFGTDTTLDILTWNIERFPKNGQTTIYNVKEIIENLNADIIAIQEVSDISSFNQMVQDLDGYNGYLESTYFRGLAYIYNTNVIQINDIYEIYTTSEYWNYFPRNPMVMDFNYKEQRFIIINNHFKCCGDGSLDLDNQSDEETRRYHASRLLKEYIDSNFSDVNVFLVGDLNDSLTDNVDQNTFQNFIDDSNNFLFADMEIATGSSSDWSYPTWPSHLDHILISNELFDDFQNQNSSIEVIKIEDHLTNGWSEYDTNITDHRPVGLKLFIENALDVNKFDLNNSSFKSYPNPFDSEITFTINSTNTIDEIQVFSITGQKVASIKVSSIKEKIKWNASKLSNGIYFAKLISNNKPIASNKLILIK